MCILSYVFYYNQGKPLSYCGKAYYQDGDPTPIGVRSSWDFMLGRPPIVGSIQHCQQTANPTVIQKNI